jgi:hypothetical protein
MMNFETIGKNIGNLVDQKQKAYGDAISAIECCIRVLYPAGIQPDQYPKTICGGGNNYGN